MIKFDNKLELRYYFNDKSNYMDAMIKHRSEKEVLSLVRTLADMLDIKMTVYCESFAQQEGFREIWSVAGENSRLISVLLNLFMQVWTRPSLLVGGQPVVDRSVADEEKMQREIALLRSNLRKKIPGITVTRELVELLSASPRFCKCKSNFYEAVRGYPKVTKFTLRELNENNRSRSGSLEVKREQFDYYRNLIAMRKAHPAFRMTSAADIARNIVFDKVKGDCVVSYSIKNHANGDEWQEVKVVFNGNDRDVTVNVAKGNWTVVAADGKIDKDGLGKSKGGKTVVASRSALILAR